MPQARARLVSMKDEVGELHPLLLRLLPKLPTIERVEYTHGRDELGAFRLQQKSRCVAGHEYVGVIAKVGKIQQDHRDIDRQIDEWLVELSNLPCAAIEAHLH